MARCEEECQPRVSATSSAVQLAWGHAAVAEAAHLAGVACIHVDIDLEKAFDTVDLCRLTDEALAVGFPAKVLCLSVLSYLHPRRLQIGREIGPTVCASRGIIAGSAAATSELALALRRPFLGAIKASAADVTLYVDDSTAAFVGPPRSASRRAVAFSEALGRRLTFAKFSLPPSLRYLAPRGARSRRLPAAYGR